TLAPAEGEIQAAVAAAVPGRPGIGLPVPARVQFRSPEVGRAERLLVEEGRRLRFGAGGTAALNERGDHGDGAAAHLVDRLAHVRSEEHTSELQSRFDLVCRLLLEKKN